MEKPTVAVVFGSRSTEHDVSIVTAISSIISPLQLSENYNVVPVYIAKDGKWYCDPKLADIKLYSSGKIKDFLVKQKPIAIKLGGGLTLVKTGLKTTNIKVDIVFPGLHGSHGEDGEIMALCELADVAYVGCDVRSSVIAMDKVLAKQIAMSQGIETPKYHYFYRYDYIKNKTSWLKKINEDLKYPLFVKPAHLGSSIGIARVTNAADLENAIEVALHYDEKALVEEAVSNLTEVTLPIIGNDEPTPGLLEEPLTKPEDFFDFEAKYMHGGKKGKGGGTKGSQGYSKLPADLPDGLYDRTEKLGLEVYRALGCSGIARIDMLIDRQANKVYFNEVNPLPGSLYAHNFAKAGISNVELVSRLIQFAKERYKQSSSLENTFETSFLEQF